MKLKTLNFKGLLSRDILPELMYEIASARVEGVDLIRFNITKSTDEETRRASNRRISAIARNLKMLKQKRLIQFFAFPANFVSFGTEASYLINKYPELFEIIPEETECETFVFIKI